MKNDKVAILVNPDIVSELKDFNLPVLFPKIGISPMTVDNRLGDGSETVDWDFSTLTGVDRHRIDVSGICVEVVTKFGLHCGDSVMVSLMIVNG